MNIFNFLDQTSTSIGDFRVNVIYGKDLNYLRGDGISVNKYFILALSKNLTLYQMTWMLLFKAFMGLPR